MNDFLPDSGVAAITLSYRGDKTGGDAHYTIIVAQFATLPLCFIYSSSATIAHSHIKRCYMQFWQS